MMSCGIFPADLGRVMECDIGNEVCSEAQHVDGREINSCAGGRLATKVEYWLRVKGQGPADGVDPAKEQRYCYKKRSRHFGQQFISIIKS